jgi:hypothetical protein
MHMHRLWDKRLNTKRSSAADELYDANRLALMGSRVPRACPWVNAAGEILGHTGTHGESSFRTQCLPHRIPCGLDPEISPAHPESWRERLSEKDPAKDLATDERGGVSRTKYPGGSHSQCDDHPAKIRSQRSGGNAQGSNSESIAQEVRLVEQPWISYMALLKMLKSPFPYGK